MSKTSSDRKSVKQMSNDDYWNSVWNKKPFQKLFSLTPKFIKTAFHKSSDFIEQHVPKLTKASGDRMSTISKNISYGIGCLQDVLERTEEDVERDMNDDSELHVDQNAPVNDSRKKAKPLDYDGGPHTIDDFIAEEDRMKFTGYLNIRLEHDLFQIVGYNTEYKPSLRQMLADARNRGFIDNSQFETLTEFKDFRNKIQHNMPHDTINDKKKQKWVETVFSLEE